VKRIDGDNIPLSSAPARPTLIQPTVINANIEEFLWSGRCRVGNATNRTRICTAIAHASRIFSFRVGDPQLISPYFVIISVGVADARRRACAYDTFERVRSLSRRINFSQDQKMSACDFMRFTTRFVTTHRRQSNDLR